MNRMLEDARAWAKGKLTRAPRTQSHMWFDNRNRNAGSYNALLARIISDTEAEVTDKHYSVTTAGHRNVLITALDAAGFTITVVDTF